MYHPTEDWKQVAGMPQNDIGIAYAANGWTNLASLQAQRAIDPDLFSQYSVHDIASTLGSFEKCCLNQNPRFIEDVILPLYRAYDVRAHHAFRAWDFDRRIELMHAINSIPDLETRLMDDRFNMLNDLHQMHACIYGFTPDTLELVHTPAEMLGGTTYTICHGSRDALNNRININTYFPDKVNIPAKFHWADASEIAGLVFHEGRHTHQTKMGQNAELMQYDEFRAVATIMELNCFGDYYLNGGNHNHYMANPCEKDAYDFQQDMQDFIKADPAHRTTLIFQMEQRRDAHLKSISPRPDQYVANCTQEMPALQAA